MHLRNYTFTQLCITQLRVMRNAITYYAFMRIACVMHLRNYAFTRSAFTRLRNYAAFTQLLILRI